MSHTTTCNTQKSSAATRKYFTPSQLSNRMKKAKIKAGIKAVKYGAKKELPFNRGPNETKSLYRRLLYYANQLLIEFGDFTDKSIPNTERLIQGKRLARYLYIYCSSAARIVVWTLRKRAEQIKMERGRHWLDIRKICVEIMNKNEACIGGWEDEHFNTVNPDATNEILKNGMHPPHYSGFHNAACWYDNNVKKLPKYWWDWYSVEKEKNKAHEEEWEKECVKPIAEINWDKINWNIGQPRLTGK
jgi:hypothetical protein